ncbi:MAG: hypothetical protein KAJ63_14050 [Methyloprofundus sp.]|nr:hypothetical protein [Methyloprofundus sp.]
MQMQTLNDKQQRWLAIGLLLTTIMSIALLIFMPWYNSLTKTLEDIDEQIFRDKRYQRVIASREEVLTEIEQGRIEINSLGYFSAQTKPSLAAAELQKRLKEMVQNADGEISSTQVLPNKDADGLLRITVKVKLTGDMEMLRNLLFEIDVEKPLMMIENLTIVPSPAKRNRKTRKREQTGKIVVTLEVSSYIRKEM